MGYTYAIHKKEKAEQGVYSREELEELTTLQLRDVCKKEKLVYGAAYKIDRPYLIKLILKYRGTAQNIFVDTFDPGRLGKVIDKFSSEANRVDVFASEANISTPTEICLYTDLETTVYDNFYVDGDIICEGNALLIGDKNRVCGILNVRKHEGRHWITCNHRLLSDEIEPKLYRNYSIGFLSGSDSKHLFDYYYETPGILPAKVKCYIKSIPELRLAAAQEAGTALAIDFGTSNTSAGAHIDEQLQPRHVIASLRRSNVALNDINKVKFINTLGQQSCLAEILPTVICVENCGEPDNIIYSFGYDALKSARRDRFAGQASVFYGIKMWVNDYEKAEEIFDEEGNTASVSRREIIKAYFEYIIRAAERQHKCRYRTLHITSPVKQKQQFLDMYKDIFAGYDVVSEASLDEGVAALYNNISEKIEERDFTDGQKYEALVIDCGGGTTDLTKCEYTVRDNGITYELDMTTTYTNGDTNFGGNNITFRIFQYLKVLFSSYYSNTRVAGVEHILDTSLDIYRSVDKYDKYGENGVAKHYEMLDRLYSQSEELLPTRFGDYKALHSEAYRKVKSNFYFLWNLAEKIKTDFFGSSSVIQTSFHERGILSSDKQTKILAEESWMLYLTKNLELETRLPEIVITKEEIITLIKADIYGIIKKFIRPICEAGDFDFNNVPDIELTGQTCKIDVFRDALKEFIPGRILGSGKKGKTVLELKMTCLEGAIKYQSAKRIGLIAPQINNEAPFTTYKLIAYTHTEAEVVMIESSKRIDQKCGFVSRHIETENVELFLLDAENKQMHKYAVFTDFRQFARTNYEDEVISKEMQEDIDSIKDNEMKIFTFTLEDRWGFYVLAFARKNGQLLIGDKKYFPFENDEWEQNFFDGSH